MEVVELVAARRRRRRPTSARRSPRWPPPTTQPNASMQAIAAAYPDAPGWTVDRHGRPSRRRASGAACRSATHGNWVIGAPEMLLPAGDAGARRSAGQRAEQGLRVLLLGRSREPVDAPDAPAVGRRRSPSSCWPRPSVPTARRRSTYFREQGVAVKVISGDDPRTVGAIAVRLGLEQADRPGRRPRARRRLGGHRRRRRDRLGVRPRHAAPEAGDGRRPAGRGPHGGDDRRRRQRRPRAQGRRRRRRRWVPARRPPARWPSSCCWTTASPCCPTSSPRAARSSATSSGSPSCS